MQAVNSAVATLGRQAADVAGLLAQLQPVQSAVSTATELLQNLEHKLLSVPATSSLAWPAASMATKSSALSLVQGSSHARSHQPASCHASVDVTEAAALQLELAAQAMQLERRMQEIQDLKDRQQQLLSGEHDHYVLSSCRKIAPDGQTCMQPGVNKGLAVSGLLGGGMHLRFSTGLH